MRNAKSSLYTCRRLASAISPWLYSKGSPPKELNDVFLAWVDGGKIPSDVEVTEAIAAAGMVEVPQDRG
jgi:hypothetical protein